MRKAPLIARLLILSLGGLASPAFAGVLSPFTAIYQVERDATPLGHARFTLSPQGQNCHLYRGVATPEGLAALLAGRTVEESHFCVAGGKIRPLTYRTHEDGGDSGDNYTLNFDWNNRQVRLNEGTPRMLPLDGLDPLSLQIALRKKLSDAGPSLPEQTFDITVVEDDKEKTYSFKVAGRETVPTPLGKLEAVRVDRVDSARKQLRMWLAPSLDYLPVKVERQQKKGAIIRLRIETLPDSPVD